MTTQNTTNRLTNRVILTMPYDPSGGVSGTIDSEHATHESAQTVTNTGFTVNNRYAEVIEVPKIHSGTQPKYKSDGSQRRDHWQDFVPDVVMTKTMGSSNRYENTSAMGMANEFEVDCELLVHSWATMVGVTSLPGLTSPAVQDLFEPRQLNCMSIDLGMMREVITCKGIIVDRDTHPNSTSGHHLRRQHLLDIVRSQWANVHNFNRSTGYQWNNPNRLPALTIGPKHGIPPSGGSGLLDADYYGEEPCSDIRGREVRATSSNTVDSAAWITWDNSFSYEGRRRYRGIMKRVTCNLVAGQPDIWRFSFEFHVVKNELEQRDMANDDDDSETSND